MRFCHGWTTPGSDAPAPHPGRSGADPARLRGRAIRAGAGLGCTDPRGGVAGPVSVAGGRRRGRPAIGVSHRYGEFVGGWNCGRGRLRGTANRRRARPGNAAFHPSGLELLRPPDDHGRLAAVAARPAGGGRRVVVCRRIAGSAVQRPATTRPASIADEGEIAIVVAWQRVLSLINTSLTPLESCSSGVDQAQA
jgi:hypothetical protein